jgi:hypothetical protein
LIFFEKPDAAWRQRGAPAPDHASAHCGAAAEQLSENRIV